MSEANPGGRAMPHVLSALALVVLVAVGFWGIGNLRGDAPAIDDVPPVASDDGTEEPDDGTDATDDGQTPPPDDDADDGDGDDADDAEDADDADDADDGPSIEPGSVTIQVLDGSRGDGTQASALAGELRDAGYQVVAENNAIPYERTTVFWTEGNEDAARQVARDLGAEVVEEQPGTLSETVDVHVVVGADRVTEGTGDDAAADDGTTDDGTTDDATTG